MTYQADGSAEHLHQAQPPPVLVSLRQEASVVCASWQASAPFWA